MVERGAGAHCTTIGRPRRFGGGSGRWRHGWCLSYATLCSSSRLALRVFGYRCRGFAVGGACWAVECVGWWCRWCGWCGCRRCGHGGFFSGRAGGSALAAAAARAWTSSAIDFRELREHRNACGFVDDLFDGDDGGFDGCGSSRDGFYYEYCDHGCDDNDNDGWESYASTKGLVCAAAEPEQRRGIHGEPPFEHGGVGRDVDDTGRGAAPRSVIGVPIDMLTMQQAEAGENETDRTAKASRRRAAADGIDGEDEPRFFGGQLTSYRQRQSSLSGRVWGMRRSWDRFGCTALLVLAWMWGLCCLSPASFRETQCESSSARTDVRC